MQDITIQPPSPYEKQSIFFQDLPARVCGRIPAPRKGGKRRENLDPEMREDGKGKGRNSWSRGV